MVRLSDFVSDRRLAIEKNEMEAKREEERKSFSTIKDAGAAISEGISGFRRLLQEARANYDKFLSVFPKFPSELTPNEWYNAWLGEQAVLDKIFGKDLAPANYEDVIIKRLCNFNVENK